MSGKGFRDFKVNTDDTETSLLAYYSLKHNHSYYATVVSVQSGASSNVRGPSLTLFSVKKKKKKNLK